MLTSIIRWLRGDGMALWASPHSSQNAGVLAKQGQLEAARGCRQMTHSIPASPPSEPKPEPYATGNETGFGQQHAVGYHEEDEVQPL